MSFTITFADVPQEVVGLAALMRQYLEWDIAEFQKASGISLSVEEYFSNTMDHLQDYMPPDGRLAMAQDESGTLVGIVLLKKLSGHSAEIKRLYVDPEARGAGLGKKLLERLLEEARKIGYERVFQDTATYMPAAQRLYRSFGFRETGPYPGSENDEAVKKFLTFMDLKL